MQYSEERDGAIRVIEITETRLEARNAQALRELLVSRIEKGDHRLVVDLRHVTFMDSSALGSLIGAMKKMRPVGVLALAGATGPVLQLMKLTRMDKVFWLFPDVDAARVKLED